MFVGLKLSFEGHFANRAYLEVFSSGRADVNDWRTERVAVARSSVPRLASRVV